MNAKAILVGLGALLVIFVVLIIAVGVGIYWYLFGPVAGEGAEFLPSNTIYYTAVDNGLSLVTQAQSTKLATLMNVPKIQQSIGMDKLGIPADKQALILKSLLILSGQSFGAITTFDSNDPDNMAGVVGVRPRPGTDAFDTMVDEVLKQDDQIDPATDLTTGSYSGVNFRCLAKNKSKVYIFHTGPWDMLALNESALHDWVDRFQHKAASPSLSENAQFKLSTKQLGDRNLFKVFLNVPELIAEHKDEIASSNKLSLPLDQVGGLAYGATVTSDGFIQDRLVLNLPKTARPAMSIPDAPCPYETEKFTTADTNVYGAATLDLNPIWKKYNEQAANDPDLMSGLQQLKSTADSKGFDVEKNVIQAVGGEISLQLDWPKGAAYPQGGLFVKIKDADAFKPARAALLNSYPDLTSATVGSVNLKVMPLPDGPAEYSPCITADGPYLAVFSSLDEAKTCLAQTNGLASRSEVGSPGGVLLGHSSGALFLDIPNLIDNISGSNKVMTGLSLAALSNDSYKPFYDFMTDPDKKEPVKALGSFRLSCTWNDDSLILDSNSGFECYACSVLGLVELGKNTSH